MTDTLDLDVALDRDWQRLAAAYCEAVRTRDEHEPPYDVTVYRRLLAEVALIRLARVMVP